MTELGSALCLISKISTLVDGGIRITLDLSADNIDLIQKLLVKTTKTEQVFVAFVDAPND